MRCFKKGALILCCVLMTTTLVLSTNDMDSLQSDKPRYAKIWFDLIVLQHVACRDVLMLTFSNLSRVLRTAQAIIVLYRSTRTRQCLVSLATSTVFTHD